MNKWADSFPSQSPHSGEGLTSLRRYSFSLTGVLQHPSSDAGSQGGQGGQSRGPEPAFLASILDMSRYRKSEGQRTNIKTEALPSDLPTSTYLVQGDRWLPRLFPRAVQILWRTLSPGGT